MSASVTVSVLRAHFSFLIQIRHTSVYISFMFMWNLATESYKSTASTGDLQWVNASIIFKIRPKARFDRNFSGCRCVQTYLARYETPTPYVTWTAPSLYSISLLRQEFHFLGPAFPRKSIYGSSKNNLFLLNTILFSYMAKNVSGLIPFYFKAPLSRSFRKLTRIASRTEFWSLKDESRLVQDLGSFSSWKGKAGHNAASAGGRTPENQRCWSAAHGKSLGNGSSWKITTVLHTLTMPSGAATKHLPVLFQRQSRDRKFCKSHYPMYLWEMTPPLNI